MCPGLVCIATAVLFRSSSLFGRGPEDVGLCREELRTAERCQLADAVALAKTRKGDSAHRSMAPLRVVARSVWPSGKGQTQNRSWCPASRAPLIARHLHLGSPIMCPRVQSAGLRSKGEHGGDADRQHGLTAAAWLQLARTQPDALPEAYRVHSFPIPCVCPRTQHHRQIPGGLPVVGL